MCLSSNLDLFATLLSTPAGRRGEPVQPDFVKLIISSKGPMRRSSRYPSTCSCAAKLWWCFPPPHPWSWSSRHVGGDTGTWAPSGRGRWDALLSPFAGCLGFAPPVENMLFCLKTTLSQVSIYGASPIPTQKTSRVPLLGVDGLLSPSKGFGWS